MTEPLANLRAGLRWLRGVTGLESSTVRSASSYIDVERAEQKFYLEYVREGMTVFDVGANIGELTLLFSRFVGSGSVHAFEASSAVYSSLSAVVTAAQRRNVLLNHVALSDKPGTVDLHCYDGPYQSWNSLADRPLEAYGIDVKTTRTETTRATTVDAYCAEFGIEHIDLLKVDVEGAELQVLKGARRMLQSRAIACVAFEFGQTTFDMGNAPSDFRSLADECGYSLSNLIPGEPLFPGGDSVVTAQFAMHLARPR